MQATEATARVEPRTGMLKRRLLLMVYFVCYWLGVISLCYALQRRHKLILTYHNVIPDQLFDGALHLGMSHPLSIFVKQIELIRQRFEITTELGGSGDRSCVVTFDDGYRNNITAAEELEKAGCRGIFFVPVHSTITGQPLVIDQVLLWFSYAPVGRYVVQGLSFELTEDHRAEAYSRFYGWMYQNVQHWQAVPRWLDECWPFSAISIPEQLKKTVSNQ